MNVPTIIFVLYLTSSLFVAAPAYSKESFRLKPGAEGKICLKCHETVKENLKSRFAHPLVKKVDCTGCHVPHTSSHKNLLTAGKRELCYNCHKEVLPENARSTHEIVVEGNCTKCHDAHGASKKFILTEEGNKLCFDCHKDMGEAIGKVRFKHRSLERDKGCLSCHDPHASATSQNLLLTEVPTLCKKCHQTNKLTFRRTHMDYPVGNANCTSCHDPHGSNQRGMIFDTAHAAVAERKCTECHQKATKSKIPRTKKQGTELCKECHGDMINKTLDRNRVHWPLVDDVGCLNCHSPHATKEKKLLHGPQTEVCGRCHGDTVELQELSKKSAKNEKLCEPVRTGNCITCHSPHAADKVLLIEQPSITADLCGRCHEWQTHSTHPIGEKTIDQRNKNLNVGCLSCHKACGTSNKPFMMPFDTVYELCIQCHVELKR